MRIAIYLLLASPMLRLQAQTPELEMNVVYVCKDGQSFKVFSCDKATGACDFQNYKGGRANQRGEALRAQLAVLLTEKCHAQTAAEATADPHTGEIPRQAPVPARRPTPAAPAPQNVNQMGAGPFKVGDPVRILSSGWQNARVLQVHGNSYFVQLDNGIQVSKIWPAEVRRMGKLTAEDHAAGQWDLHEKVQVLVNGTWMEGEIVGQDYSRYRVQLPGPRTLALDGDRTVDTGPENLRASTASPVRTARPAGQAPQPGLASCAGKFEGRWELSAGAGGMTVVFRSGKVTVSEGLGGPMEFECFTGGGKIVMYPAGSTTPFAYGFDINNDGTLQTPLGEIKKKGN